MKQSIFIILIILSLKALSQDTTYYINDSGNKFRYIGNKNDGQFEGKVIWYLLDSNDKPLDKIFFIADYLHGKKEGRQVIYNPDSSIAYISMYHNDSLEGLAINYFPKGNIHDLGSFHLGNHDGMQVQYNDSGILLSVTEWRDEDETAEVVFYPNGKIAAKGNKIHGFKAGEWIEFDSMYTYYKIGNYHPFTNKLEEKYATVYEKGSCKIGKWNTYSIDGKFLKSDFYNCDEEKKKK